MVVAHSKGSLLTLAIYMSSQQDNLTKWHAVQTESAVHLQLVGASVAVE